MAKISELTELTLPTLDDYVVVNDTSGSTVVTKRIAVKYLLGVAQDEADVADADLVVL